MMNAMVDVDHDHEDDDVPARRITMEMINIDQQDATSNVR